MIDDLQWADGGTTALLFHLGRRLAGRRILLVCAYRPEELDFETAPGTGVPQGLGGILQELTREWGDVLIDLEQADGWAFVQAYVGSEPNRLGAVFRKALYDQTDGNPLFTAELPRCLRRQGALVRDDCGQWVEAAEPDWDRCPPQMEAVSAGHLAGRPGTRPPGGRPTHEPGPGWRTAVAHAGALGHSDWSEGQFVSACEHLERALELYDPEAGRPLSPVLGADPRVMGRCVLGVAQWFLGYADQGRGSLEQASEEAEAIGHLPTVAFAHMLAALLHSLLGRDATATRGHLEAVRPLGQSGQFYDTFSHVLAAQEHSANPRMGTQPRLLRTPGLEAVRAR